MKNKKSNNSKKNLTESFVSKDDLNSVEHNELNLLLRNEFGGASTNIQDSQIVYGAKSGHKFYITYKKGTQEILKFEADYEVPDLRCGEICALIKQFIKASGEESISSEVLFSRYPFKSSFCYKNLFTLECVPDGYPIPEDMTAPHPLILHYKYTKTGRTWLDIYRKETNLDVIINLVSILTRGNIYYLEESRKIWVMQKKNHNTYLPSKLKYPGYFYNQYNDVTNRFSMETTIPHCLYPDLNVNLINMYFKLSKDLKKEFMIGCRWYYKATQSSNQTESYQNYIIMIEHFLPKVKDNSHYKLLKKYKKINESLQNSKAKEHFQNFLAEYQKIIENPDGITFRFKNFLETYVGISDKELQSDLYALRCKITHAAKIIANKRNCGVSSDTSPISQAESILAQTLSVICKRLLINWLNIKSEDNEFNVIPVTAKSLWKEHFDYMIALESKSGNWLPSKSLSGA